MDSCKGYGRIIYVNSQEEADRLMEEDRNLPTLEELYKQREELDKKIFEAHMLRGFPKVYLVDGKIYTGDGARYGKR